jgi:hypothetical protein
MAAMVEVLIGAVFRDLGDGLRLLGGDGGVGIGGCLGWWFVDAYSGGLFVVGEKGRGFWGGYL